MAPINIESDSYHSFRKKKESVSYLFVFFYKSQDVCLFFLRKRVKELIKYQILQLYFLLNYIHMSSFSQLYLIFKINHIHMTRF
jgi:hypothetical protein